MKSFDIHSAGRAFILFLLGLLTYLLTARGIQQPPCPNTICGNGISCAACPLQSGCTAAGEAQ